MPDGIREIVGGMTRDFRTLWRHLAWTDLAYKFLAFSLLTPTTALFLRWLLSRTDRRVLTEAEIPLFFVTKPWGWIALLLGGGLIVAITLLEVSCLLGIGFAGREGVRLRPKNALAFGAAKAMPVLRLGVNMVGRVVLGLVPFLLALGSIYWILLRGYDINFYLARRPPAYWAAAGLAGCVLIALGACGVWSACRWALALPLVLFEGVSPRSALCESAKRSEGRRGTIAATLLLWSLTAAALACAPAGMGHLLGRSLAPRFAGSLTLLLVFVAVFVFLLSATYLAVAVFNATTFSLLLNRLYLHIGDPRSPEGPSGEASGDLRLSNRMRALVVVLGLLASLGVALFAFRLTNEERPVAVIAHRGASFEAPENTLSSFNRAIAEGADFVEFDVQESEDGEVVVVHDSDLMKVGGSPLKIWLAALAQLRAVDLGKARGPQFAGERLPTFEETLAACKGRVKVVVELKSYGHDQHLEEKVVRLVEAAGMEHDAIFMSLDHGMIRKMKALRPGWRCGILVAEALGDLTSLQADFLAVEARIATWRFVRKAHGAGQQVYVWTVNDPAWMLAILGRGADGLITDKPALARQVIERRHRMSDAQRVLAALLVRWGASTDALESERALRP